MAVAPPEGRGRKGEASSYGWTSKNYVICVCTAVNVSASGGLRILQTPYTPIPSSLPPCYKILAAPPLVGGTCEMGMVGPTLLFNAVTYMALTIHKSEN